MAFNKETQEFKTGAQNNYGWNLTWEATGKFPIIAKRAFKKLEDAQAYVDDPTQTACEGLILAVFNDVEKNNGIYLVQSVGTADTPGVLVKAGSGTGSITAENYTAAKALATDDNKGQLIYVLSEETSTTEKDENDEFIVYSAGPYVVTGANAVSKLGTTSASGDLAGDVETLKGNVSTLQADVKALKEAEIDFPVDDVQVNGTSIVVDGIANFVVDQEFVDNSESLNAIAHKAIAAKFAAVEEQISLIPKFSVEVVTALPEENISETTIYLVKPTPEKDETTNLYEEFIYLGAEKGWEKLGTQKLDLSGYYTSEEVDNLLLGYVAVEEGKSLISAEDLAKISANEEAIAGINEVLNGTGEGEEHTPGLVERVEAAEGEIDSLQGETIVGVESTNQNYLVSAQDETNTRLTKLTPVIGSFKTSTMEEKEGLVTVSSVKDFVQKEIESAFAWVEVEEGE